jgi:hypothetical protein
MSDKIVCYLKSSSVMNLIKLFDLNLSTRFCKLDNFIGVNIFCQRDVNRHSFHKIVSI